MGAHRAPVSPSSISRRRLALRVAGVAIPVVVGLGLFVSPSVPTTDATPFPEAAPTIPREDLVAEKEAARAMRSRETALAFSAPSKTPGAPQVPVPSSEALQDATVTPESPSPSVPPASTPEVVAPEPDPEPTRAPSPSPSPADEPEPEPETAPAPSGSFQDYALAQVGAEQFSCLEKLWGRESGWDPDAQNPTSTAYGIAQFLDSTWAATGISKTSDPLRQIDAGLIYIEARYGSPCSAWAHSQAKGWY